jgi:hypothetical protein
MKRWILITALTLLGWTGLAVAQCAEGITPRTICDTVCDRYGCHTICQTLC